jgi:hypothetical protein
MRIVCPSVRHIAGKITIAHGLIGGDMSIVCNSSVKKALRLKAHTGMSRDKY